MSDASEHMSSNETNAGAVSIEVGGIRAREIGSVAAVGYCLWVSDDGGIAFRSDGKITALPNDGTAYVIDAVELAGLIRTAHADRLRQQQLPSK